MNEVTEKKIRDLRIKIAMLEKEQKQSQHTMGLQGWLRAGHAGQLSRAAEKDRTRIEERLAQLRTHLEELLAGNSNAPDQKKAAAESAATKSKSRKK